MNTIRIYLKKVLAAAVTAALLFGTAASSGIITYAAETYNSSMKRSYKFGDMNDDGEHNINDLLVMKKLASGESEITEEQRIIADLNGDGKVDDVDIQELKRVMMNSISAEDLPVCSMLADYGYCGENVKYMLDNEGTLTIFGTGEMYDFKYSAPWKTANQKDERIKKVVIKDEVTSIGNYTFIDHIALSSISIGKSVRSIGIWAFEYCPKLSAITVPKSVEVIGEHAFEACSGLKSVSFNSGLKTIGKSAFYNCSALESVFLPNTVESVGVYCFYGCKSITNAKLPSNLKSLPGCMFIYCSGLESVSFPPYLETIGVSCFDGCSSLKSISLPSSLKIISQDAFAMCSALTSVMIPDGVTEIPYEAFQGCISLSEVILPKGVSNIGVRAFWRCRKLSTVKIYNNSITIDDSAFNDCGSLTLKGNKNSSAESYAASKNIPFEPFQNLSTLVTLDPDGTVLDMTGREAYSGLYDLKKSGYDFKGWKLNGTNENSSYFAEDTDIYFKAPYSWYSDSMYYYYPENPAIYCHLWKINEHDESSQDKVIYFWDNSGYLKSHGDGNIYALFLNDQGEVGNTFPGIPMEYCATDKEYENLYKISVPENATRVSFVCENDTSSHSTVAAEIRDDSIYYIYRISSSSLSVVSFKKPDPVYKWKSDEEICEFVSEGDGFRIYKYTIPAGSDVNAVIFASSNYDQTNDIAIGTVCANDMLVPTAVILRHLNSETYGDWCEAQWAVNKEFKSLLSEQCFNPMLASTASSPSESEQYYAYWENHKDSYINSPYDITKIEDKYVSNGDPIALPMNHILYEDWEERSHFVVSFDLNDGSGRMLDPVSIYPEESAYIPDSYIPQRAGYNFYGWSRESVSVEHGLFPNDLISFTEDTTLYAVWKRTIENCTVIVSQMEYEYNGSEMQPAVTVTDGTKTLVKGTDYTVTYSNNINAGKDASVTVIGKGNYSGKASVPFTINAKSLADAEITLSRQSYMFNGAPCKPTVTVTLDGKTLVKDTDYTVTYSNNINAGKDASVTVTGKGNYSGKASVLFTINKKQVTALGITLEADTYKYDGTAKTPAVIVADGNKTLVINKDYTLKYGNNVNEGTAYVLITGQNNYGGSIKKTFTITSAPQPSIADMLITVNTSYGIVYNGKAQKPEVTIQKGKTKLRAGTDFSCTYTDNVNAGNASVKIEGIGKYTGTVTRSFTIQPMSVRKAFVRVKASNLIYNGRKKQPDIEVTLNGKTLVRGTDYSVVYSNNTNIGMALVSAKGKGNYKDSASATFAIIGKSEPFTWGYDNWNFINSSYLGYFSRISYRKQISRKYIDVLSKSLTNSEFQTVFIGDSEHTAWLDTVFKGACYGMSSTVLLAKAGFVNPSDYQSGAKCLYALDMPKVNSNVCSLITYYQMLQVKDVIQQQYRTVPNMSNKDVIETIKKLLNSQQLVLIGFKKENWGGHAIVAYKYEEGNSWAVNGKNYGGRIWIYDPNSSMNKNTDYFIYYNPFTYEWEIPGYRNDSISSAYGARFNYVGADVNEINCGGYLHRVNEVIRNNGSYVARIDANKIASNRSVSKMVHEPGGSYMNTSAEAGEIVADYSFIVLGESKGTAGYNLFDSESAYKITQYSPQELDLSMDYEFCDLNASAAAGSSVIFDKIGYIGLESASSDYTLSMTWDEDYPTDWFSINVSGSNANNVTLEKAEEGYILSADNIKGLKIRANNRTETVTAGLTATKYRSVFIYETEDKKLGIRVDTDDNGTYETDLNAVSLLENTSVISAEQIKKGDTVSVTASATGGTGGYSYSVLYKKNSSDNWATAQSFDENPAVSIKPTSAGKYDICVKVRDSRGTVEKKYFTLKVTAPLENDSTISATSISKGAFVTVKADATGGTGSYEYAVYYKKASSSTWTTAQSFKTNAKITVTPSGTGSYDICVKVRDSSGSISKKYFSVNVAAPLTNKSVISSAYISLGDTVTVKASASGGSGGYRYAVLYKKSSSSSWTTKQDYGTNTSVTIKPGAAVNYDICVKVKDDKGSIVKKTFTVSVTK